jgi:hypothetical protein
MAYNKDCIIATKNTQALNFLMSHNYYEVVSESSPTVIVVTVSVKEYERGGKGHTSESLLHQSAM